METTMNEPARRSMTNGPVQKRVKKYRMADSMTTHPGDEESMRQAVLSFMTASEQEDLDDQTKEWLKNKQYPTAGDNEDNQESHQT